MCRVHLHVPVASTTSSSLQVPLTIVTHHDASTSTMTIQRIFGRRETVDAETLLREVRVLRFQEDEQPLLEENPE